jgi:hypothetical protein
VCCSGNPLKSEQIVLKTSDFPDFELHYCFRVYSRIKIPKFHFSLNFNLFRQQTKNGGGNNKKKFWFLCNDE